MDRELQRRITRYLNKDSPLGPPDATLIKDHEVAAHLFDPHNASFNALLKRDISVVIGRRGSGKTALLNSYQYRPYLAKEAVSQKLVNFDLNDYQIVIPILGNRMFERMQNHVAGPSGLLRPIESVIEDWSELVIDYILFMIWQRVRKGHGNSPYLEILERYLTAPETRKKSEAYRLIWGQSIFDALKSFFVGSGDGDSLFPNQSEALLACDGFLEDEKLRVVAIFDSMDEYQTGDARADRTVGALLRFAAQFNATSERIKLKLGLPAEIFPEIERASANPLKDFVNFDQVRWSSVELAQIAAYRYRLFLQIFDEEYYPEVAGIELTRRGATRFWQKFFPNTQINRYAHSEDAMTYMLRHTQLLPRQLFRILHRVIRASQAETGGYRLLTPNAVSESILDMESIIAQEIIQGFKHVYPFAEAVAKAVFGNFPTVFTYDQLENKWRRVGRPMLRDRDSTFELVQFTEMLLRMGIMGVVESETDRYVEGKFAYHQLMPFAIGEKMTLAIHPVFSRYFSCSPNRQRKSILPQGASLDA